MTVRLTTGSKTAQGQILNLYKAADRNEPSVRLDTRPGFVLKSNVILGISSSIASTAKGVDEPVQRGAEELVKKSSFLQVSRKSRVKRCTLS